MYKTQFIAVSVQHYFLITTYVSVGIHYCTAAFTFYSSGAYTLYMYIKYLRIRIHKTIIIITCMYNISYVVIYDINCYILSIYSIHNKYIFLYNYKSYVSLLSLVALLFLESIII